MSKVEWGCDTSKLKRPAGPLLAGCVIVHKPRFLYVGIWNKLKHSINSEFPCYGPRPSCNGFCFSVRNTMGTGTSRTSTTLIILRVFVFLLKSRLTPSLSVKSCVCGIVAANSRCVVSCSGWIVQCVRSEDYMVKKNWLKLSLCLRPPAFLKLVNTW